jgi:hypothetical protein
LLIIVSLESVLSLRNWATVLLFNLFVNSLSLYFVFRCSMFYSRNAYLSKYLVFVVSMPSSP